ncbi:ATP-binding protein involved in chromosome partitioning [Paenibacillus sp. UNCCL117]|uniref:P-loop NTPase n=1 Tax=unclassified Paenibacillus TaxID=185978 RepID=UPI0008801E0A|nr:MULTISPECIES: P-loop NTPase [unclassified Paenibacillus]SDE57484.1 ATP-binding protein involved in chromosome partitioning [Paenibacillus sp. cl123]SFW68404.1 ATP-binding protein involved in chromosome partitioning [Paenibacillus sp. UNCCL117]
MLTREQLLASLSEMKDPVYGGGLVELNMIRDMMIKETQVSVTVLLSSEAEAHKSELQRLITKRFEQQGASAVHVRFRPLSDYEREEVQRKLQAQGGSAPVKENSSAGQAEAAAGTPLNVLDPQSGVSFIAVASGKGGVGKSTVTVNLAVALARLGKKVGLVDADIYGFSVPDMMGIEERPQLVDNRIIPVERFGVKVISMGFFVEENTPVIWRGPMLGKMLRNFFNEVEWGELDYLLLDLPPGTGDVALDVHQMIPQSKEIIVTTPHATAAFVAARAGAMAIHTDHQILGIVENMSYYACSACGQKDYVFGRGGGAKLAEELHAPLLAQIPLGVPDNHVAEPDYSPSVYKAESDTGRIYLEVAERIMNVLQKGSA